MQCTVLQPKGNQRTSTLPTTVTGIPSPKDIAAVLRRATEPEAIGQQAWNGLQLHLFGYKTGKTGTENQNSMPPSLSSGATLYGEAAVIAMGGEGAPVAFPAAQWAAFLKEMEEAEDSEAEDSDAEDMEDEDEADEAEEAEESDAEEESEDESQGDAGEAFAEEEEEVAAPVVKVTRVKRANKKVLTWFTIPPITTESEHPLRATARQQIHHFLQNQLTPSEEAELETAILGYTIAEAARNHVHPVWENREFTVLYDIQVRRIITNFMQNSYVGNGRLDVRFREGEFAVAELPTMAYSTLCPEKWKDLFEKEMKREARMLEVDKSMATDMFRCSKCGKRQCTYYEMQTRSADEPMTIFVRCLNCGKRWSQ